RPVMFVEHQAVEIQQLGVGIDLLIQILIEQPGPVRPVKKLVRRPEETALADNVVFQRAVFPRLHLGIVVVGAFGKPHEMHTLPPLQIRPKTCVRVRPGRRAQSRYGEQNAAGTRNSVLSFRVLMRKPVVCRELASSSDELSPPTKADAQRKELAVTPAAAFHGAADGKETRRR